MIPPRVDHLQKGRVWKLAKGDHFLCGKGKRCSAVGTLPPEKCDAEDVSCGWAILFVISYINCTYCIIIYHISIINCDLHNIPNSIKFIKYQAVPIQILCNVFCMLLLPSDICATNSKLPSGDMIPVAIRTSKQGKKSSTRSHAMSKFRN